MANKLIGCMIILFISCGAAFTACNPGSTGTADANSRPETDTVIIEQMKFNPENLTIRRGDTVLFVNKGIVPHDATEINKAWGSPTLNPGDSWKTVPDKSADYYCSIHIVMKGKITVK